MKTMRIAALAVTGLVIGTSLFISCKKDDGGTTLPPIGGYDTSNDVAKTNLLAHWTFENTPNEVISNTAPSNVYGTTNYVSSNAAGSGQALNLVSGTLVFPPIANINTANALGSYTLSMWVNVKNNKTFFTTFFGLFPTNKQDVFGNFSAGAETGQFAPSAVADTLVLKANYSSMNADGSFNGQDNRPDPKGKPAVGVFKGAGVWSHFVTRFDASTHKLQVFGNAQSIGAYDDRGVTTVALNMMVPAQAVIGSLASSEIGFAKAGPLPSYAAKGTFAIDNIRIYNKALTDADINSLYQLEAAGR